MKTAIGWAFHHQLAIAYPNSEQSASFCFPWRARTFSCKKTALRDSSFGGFDLVNISDEWRLANALYAVLNLWLFRRSFRRHLNDFSFPKCLTNTLGCGVDGPIFRTLLCILMLIPNFSHLMSFNTI